jgi:hypothetical protein
MFQPLYKGFFQHRKLDDGRDLFQQIATEDFVPATCQPFIIPDNIKQDFSFQFQSGDFASVISEDGFVLLPNHMQHDGIVPEVGIVVVGFPV